MAVQLCVTITQIMDVIELHPDMEHNNSRTSIACDETLITCDTRMIKNSNVDYDHACYMLKAMYMYFVPVDN